MKPYIGHIKKEGLILQYAGYIILKKNKLLLPLEESTKSLSF